MDDNQAAKELFMAHRLERATRRMGYVGAILIVVTLLLGVFDVVQKVVRKGWMNIGW